MDPVLGMLHWTGLIGLLRQGQLHDNWAFGTREYNPTASMRKPIGLMKGRSLFVHFILSLVVGGLGPCFGQGMFDGIGAM